MFLENVNFKYRIDYVLIIFYLIINIIDGFEVFVILVFKWVLEWRYFYN